MDFTFFYRISVLGDFINFKKKKKHPKTLPSACPDFGVVSGGVGGGVYAASSGPRRPSPKSPEHGFF